MNSSAQHHLHVRPEAGPALRADVSSIADEGLLRDLVQTLGGNAAKVSDAAEGSAAVALLRVRQDATLLHEGAPAQAVYVLRSGSLKSVRTLEDGYEQVLSFARPADLIGFEALHNGRQPASVVALEDCTVYALALPALPALRRQCAALDQALQLALSRQLVRAAGIADMMSAVASDVRLARFLLWMSTRMAEAGQSPRRLLLRMCRRDIASLLGVAHETVSRSFTMLSEAGYVKVENREVEILDPERLRLRARNTRGVAEEAARSARQAPLPRPTVLPTAWHPQAARSPAVAV